jgi:hypothetical protein
MTRLWYLKYISVLFLLVFLSCKSEYEKLEERELSSGKRVDELFLGLKLGMEKRDFFQTCWDLNKKGLLTNGPSELSVEYSPTMPSGHPAKMRFYPKFDQEKIFLMPIEFQYEGWAPWNEELSLENLREDVRKLMEEWYGPGFIEVSNEDNSKKVYVKMDGNRRIRIFRRHISAVRVEISDLPIQKKLSQEEL